MVCYHPNKHHSLLIINIIYTRITAASIEFNNIKILNIEYLLIQNKIEIKVRNEARNYLKQLKV